MRSAASSVLLAVLVGCDAPPVFTTSDSQESLRRARIEGTVIVDSVARGNVLLFLYDAAHPPPPAGTGRPIAFTVLRQQDVFGAASGGDPGPFAAPFNFSLVATGTYLIRAMLDANGDFVPWFWVTNEPNTGDVMGDAVDAHRQPRTISIQPDASGNPVAVTNVRVLISDAMRTAVDRPVFETSVSSFTLGNAPASLELRLRGTSGTRIAEPSPVFLASLVDADGDGMPDDANGDGAPDFWPKVFVRKLSATSVLLDENDTDQDGALDGTAGFTDYEHVDGTTGATIAPDGAPDMAVLSASVDLTDLMPSLLEGGRVKATPTPVSKLTLVIKPQALDLSRPSAPALIRGIPAGRYAIIIIQSTGQTWRIPNELAPDLAGERGFFEVTSQGFVVKVP